MPLGQTIANIIEKVKTFLGLVKDEASVILHGSDKFVDEFKAIEASPLGQEVETAVEGIVTAIFPEINVPAIVSFLKQLFVDLKWATNEIDKPNDQILLDGLNYLKSTTGNVKAAQLNTLNASVAAHVSDQLNLGLTIQQTLTTPQVIHNSNVDDVAATAVVTASNLETATPAGEQAQEEPGTEQLG